MIFNQKSRLNDEKIRMLPLFVSDFLTNFFLNRRMDNGVENLPLLLILKYNISQKASVQFPLLVKNLFPEMGYDRLIAGTVFFSEASLLPYPSDR